MAFVDDTKPASITTDNEEERSNRRLLLIELTSAHIPTEGRVSNAKNKQLKYIIQCMSCVGTIEM